MKDGGGKNEKNGWERGYLCSENKSEEGVVQSTSLTNLAQHKLKSGGKEDPRQPQP